ncbi:MAG: polysaccharide deacetylase family protein [Myxococcales bacterium]
MGLACVNVDLDSIVHYCRLHGLDEGNLPAETAHAVYRRALDRFLELFGNRRLPATFFAIGEDLQDPHAAAMLKNAADAGHEIGNHTFRHDYALTRQAPADIAADVERGEEAIRAATGRKPRGFRAPGYTLTAELYGVLLERGYLYDSSVFPAAPYYLAKAGIMGARALVGRGTRAILDRPTVLTAPRVPYFPDPEEPYRQGHGRTLELPIATAPFTRAPFIGTSVLAFPRAAVAALYRTMRRQAFLNFELHGIDLLDDDDLAFPALARRQPDLNVPRSLKRERLKEVLGWLSNDFEIVTLERAALKLG